MKIESLPIQAQHALGLQNQQRPSPTGPQAAPTAGDGENPSVIVDISEAAQAASSALEETGKSSRSPAHQAKAMMEDSQTFDVFSGNNFGQLVSQFARGMDLEAIFGPPPAESSETSGETEDTPDGEAALVGVGDDDGEATTDGTTVTDGEAESGGEAAGTDIGTVAGDDGESDPAATVDPEVTLAEALLEATADAAAEAAEEITDASLIETLLEESDTTA